MRSRIALLRDDEWPWDGAGIPLRHVKICRVIAMNARALKGTNSLLVIHPAFKKTSLVFKVNKKKKNFFPHDNRRTYLFERYFLFISRPSHHFPIRDK